MAILKPNSLTSRVKSNSYQMREERRKPALPGWYVYVSGGTGDTTPNATWQSPEWLNNFTFFGTRYVGFRHGLDGDLEFIGMLDLTQGAVTGTVAFILPLPYRALTFDFPFPIYIGGNDWENGIFSVESTTGACTVYWPTKATSI